MYDKSARVYDVIYGELFDYRAHANELDQLVKARNPEASSWLDVACGTGLHLAQLQDRYEVAGIDLSAQMLSLAKERLPQVPIHQGDMVAFELGRRFDVVSCLFSSIGYTATIERLESAIASMAQHLSPGGLLLVEPWLSAEQWKDGHLGSDFVDQPDIKIARLGKNRREGRTTFLEMHHLVSTRAGVDHFVEEHELFMFDESEYRTAFLKTGLQVELIEGGLAGRGLYIGEA
ncbi:MAG TPA: class I SAM-dependent methyltransferase [Actinomycetota bacterium]|nr:class I SAM-dependent methyltransferase [Actinomycetota bacterium]